MCTKISEPPAAIEGLQLLITGLKIVVIPGLPRPVKTLDGETMLVFPLQVKRRGEGKIIEERTPRRRRFRNYSMLELDSSISGQSLWGFSVKPLSANAVKKGGKGRSGRHSGQELIIKDEGFLEIINGWRGLPLSGHPQNELLIS